MANPLGYDPQTVFNAMLSAADELIKSYGSNLTGEGMSIASVLLLITVGWSVVMWLITGDGIDAFVESIGSLVRYFLVVAVLAAWSSGSAIVDEQVSSLNAALGAKATTAEAVSSVMSSIDWVLMEPAKPKCTSAACAVLPVAVVEAASAIVNLSEKVVRLPAILLVYLMKLIAAFTLGLMLVAYLGVLVLAKVQFAVALIIGPILVPWLIWKRTEWLFDGFLRFGLIACMTNIVATLMITLMVALTKTTATVAQALNASAAGPLGTTGLDYIAAAVICIVSAVGAYLMWQVPSMAQGLLSGSGGASISKLSRSVMNVVTSPASAVASKVLSPSKGGK